jgi:hypothetical protein
MNVFFYHPREMRNQRDDDPLQADTYHPMPVLEGGDVLIFLDLVLEGGGVLDVLDQVLRSPGHQKI